MPMELNRRELKAQARERMRETRPPFWLLTLVYLLLTTGVSTLADLTGAAQFTFPPSSGDTLPLFLYLLILLYTTVMNFGYRSGPCGSIAGRRRVTAPSSTASLWRDGCC